MEKIKIYTIMLAMLLVWMTGWAQDLNSELNGYLEIAADNNPELKASFNQYLAALEKVPQMGSLPDPQASIGYFFKPMELLGGNQVANIQLMQMFPWFGTLKTAKDEASMMAKAKYELFNAIKAELFYQVKSIWYQLMKYDKEIALVKENLELLESLEKLALVKFQSPIADASSSAVQGDGSMNNAPGSTNISGGGLNSMSGMGNQPTNTNAMPAPKMPGGMNNSQPGLQDVLRVRMEILEQENRLALLSDQRLTEESKFNALLNRDLDLRVQISDSLVVKTVLSDSISIVDSILKNNPMLAMLENEISSYALMEQKAKKMGMPMLGIGLNYMLIQERAGNTAMMNGNDMLMPMVTFTIPIYRKKYTAMQNEAQLMKAAGNQQNADLRNNLLVQYRQFIQSLNDAERRISLYQEQEELAKKTTDILLSGFTTTGNNYEEVLRMLLKVLDYGFKHIEAIVDYNTSIAMAEKLMNSVIY